MIHGIEGSFIFFISALFPKSFIKSTFIYPVGCLAQVEEQVTLDLGVYLGVMSLSPRDYLKINKLKNKIIYLFPN